MERIVTTTKDGSKTLLIKDLNENYHSGHGALQEARHVFINNGLNLPEHNEIHILELGFGTGLNVLVTLNEFLRNDKCHVIHYYTLEKYPVKQAEITELAYESLFDEEKITDLNAKIHACEWEKEVEIVPDFYLTKFKCDFFELENIAMPSIDLVYFDCFGARVQPNLYTEIKALSTKIKDKNTPQNEREIALRFLIHMVGDSSQPLHVGRAEDLGGNMIKIKFFGDNTNLHSLWDSKLIDFQKYSYEEYATVLNVKSKKEIEQIQSGTLEDWFYDSQKMADTIYANTVAGAAYSYNYNYKFAQTMERQLLHGGLRLAKILNEIL